VNKYGNVIWLIVIVCFSGAVVVDVIDAFLTRQAWIAECKAQKGMGCGRECVQFCINNMPAK